MGGAGKATFAISSVDARGIAPRGTIGKNEGVTKQRTSPSLVLVGHGSTLDRRAAEPVYRAADRLRDEFASVRVAFWKEQPSIDDAIESSASDAVVVVPYFMADGYYVADAIPTAIGLTAWPELAVETVSAKSVAYTNAIGSHPGALAALESTVRESLSGRDPRDVCVALVGHGTRRTSSSRYSVVHASEALRRTGRYAEVQAAFLDDDPSVADVLSSWSQDILVIPFMVADGPHVRVDLVEALALDSFEEFGVPLNVGDRTITLAAPLGTRCEMTNIVRARADEVRGLLPEAAPSDAALAQFFDELRATPLLLGGLHIEGTPDAWAVRAESDATADEDRLLSRPARGAWRWWRRNDLGQHRPWLAGTDAPTGWIVRGTGSAELWELLELLSPGGLVSWSRGRSGSLRAFSFAELAARQTGPMRAARGFEIERLEELTGGICHMCRRRVVWRAATAVPAPRGGASDSPACELPCGRLISEACRRVRESRA